MKMTKKQNETMFKYLADTKLNHDELQGIKDTIHLMFETDNDEKANEIVLLADIHQQNLKENDYNEK